MIKKIANLPIIRRSKLYYKIQKARQYKGCGFHYEIAENKDILREIEKNGIFVLNDFLSKEKCNEILSELRIAIDLLKSEKTPFGQNTFSNTNTYVDNLKYSKINFGAYRIGDIGKLSPKANEYFFNSSFIDSMCKASVSNKAYSYRQEIDIKYEEGHKGNFLQSDIPHFDDWRFRFKAFLYLTDVKDDQAPFIYFKGSHKQGSWREKYNFEFERDGHNGRYGHFFQQEMRELIDTQGFEKLTCTGNAGTLILADFRGIHKGTTLNKGQRILLNSTYGI